MQETCLASIDAMPFDLLKKKLMARLQNMGVRIIRTYEEVVSQIDTAPSVKSFLFLSRTTLLYNNLDCHIFKGTHVVTSSYSMVS